MTVVIRLAAGHLLFAPFLRLLPQNRTEVVSVLLIFEIGIYDLCQMKEQSIRLYNLWLSFDSNLSCSSLRIVHVREIKPLRCFSCILHGHGCFGFEVSADSQKARNI